MSESTDEVLSHVCEHCAKRFYRRRYVNQYGGSREGKPVPTKYCSTACRQAHYRSSRNSDAEAAGRPGRPVTDADWGKVAPTPFVTHPDAFERLRGDAVLSKWKPSGDGKDVPDIPEYLRRPLPLQQACV